MIRDLLDRLLAWVARWVTGRVLSAFGLPDGVSL